VYETNPKSKRRGGRESWSGASCAAICDLIGVVRKPAPGRVLLDQKVDRAHRNVVRFSWDVARDREVTQLVVGFDVAMTVSGRQIARVFGFLDERPYR